MLCSFTAPRKSFSVRTYKALHAFDARESDELSLQVNEIVSVDEEQQVKVEDAWMKGTNSQGQIGIFPKDFVELVEEREPFTEFGSAFSDNFTRKLSFDTTVKSIPINNTTPTVNEDGQKSRCKATYNYSSDVDGDLVFSEGEVSLSSKNFVNFN